MKRRTVFVLVPLVGYLGLWILGTAAFLVYFAAFGVSMDLGYNAMIQRVPAFLAVVTVPLCSFASFFTTATVVLSRPTVRFDGREALRLGFVSLLATVGLDLLITVAVERVDILAFPVDLMYLLAWLVIVPSVAWAGVRTRRGTWSAMTARRSGGPR